MDILILDTDVGARNVYAGLLSSIFSGLHIRYAEDLASARSLIDVEQPDLIVLDFYSVEQPFVFMKELTEKGHPFIVIAHSDTERIIVESLKSGALDFVAKKNVKQGYLKQVLARALLEVPRWKQMQQALAAGPSYTQHERFNGELQRQAMESHASQDGARQGLDLVPGRSYRLIFQYCAVKVPSLSGMDEESAQNLINMMLDRLGAIVSAHGGMVWTRKSDANIAIFAEEDAQGALLSAIEGQGALIDLSSRLYIERPTALYAMDGGQVVYTKDHGELVSEAVNLTAHMAGKSSFEKGILITDALFQRLAQRSQKYFFRVEDEFEGRKIYSFEFTS